MRTVPSSFQTGPPKIMYRHGHEEPKQNLSASTRLNHYHSSERWQCLSREFCVLFSLLTKLFRRTLVHINTSISGEELPSRHNKCNLFCVWRRTWGRKCSVYKPYWRQRSGSQEHGFLAHLSYNLSYNSMIRSMVRS